MTIKHYQERVSDFPTVMDSGTKPLDACLLGLISTTGRFQKLANRDAADLQAASELAGETLWLLTAACNELGVDLQTAAESHLRELAELAKKHSSGSQ
jgi:hypothetical protein